MKRLPSAYVAVLLLAGLGLGAWLLWGDQGTRGQPVAIENEPLPWIAARPDDVDAGALTWRGGYILTSDSPDFGGISGLEVTPDCRRLMAVTDLSYWLRADIIDGAGEFGGLSNAQMGRLITPPGGRGKAWTDAEAVVAEDGGQSLLVAFEREARISRYRRDGWGYGPPEGVVPPEVLADHFGSGAENNQGIEALLHLPETPDSPAALLVMGEGDEGGVGGDIGGVLITGELKDGGVQEVSVLSMRRIGPYSVTDLALVPSTGDVIVLERHWTPETGVSMRIRHIPRGSIVPGAVLDGPILAEADKSYGIDNMEGISLCTAPPESGRDGEVLVFAISDDNFNHPAQRTLLLRFSVPSL